MISYKYKFDPNVESYSRRPSEASYVTKSSRKCTQHLPSPLPYLCRIPTTDPPPSFSTLFKIARLQIPRNPRQPNRYPTQLLTHAHLAPQPARLGESKRQIQHVVLVVARLLHLVEHGLVVNDDVTRAACAGAAACAFHLQVVRLRNVEQVGAVGDGEGVGLRVFVDEGYCAPKSISTGGVGAGRGRWRTLRRVSGCRGGRGAGLVWWRSVFASGGWRH
jgi:hypothetical protein